ncbi:MAG: hypothetical protein A2383_01385 [Candidatus Pacebacteria bacterium RIFOXYB1_FULL_39_46]|nr:MAG: hypothetical protein A2383_01385 [Candidatus Pacebacteria bacterium RIFOXYB1_FULL_39_46]OGJ39043.1 MAG: hypothetical protein A2182_01805 [Candidatus Pacebacteria bacterium RIFOXYA1_FULL_38_18]OGJ40014.1 MAG: hypothetical protein A2582_01330 [Candidatus Pacebacteria bacterium RIFOXYD1_FULL_39_27]OGJ40724.1 MAG: hypothetical protein A2411_00365 [Candidatus Pacebacteria bacterium RIFOXYC1_FULL_39_21]
MTGETKALIGISLVTFLIFIGGIVMLNRKNTVVLEPQNIDPTVLIREDSHLLQAEDERVMLVEFADFQCSFCASAHPIISQLLLTYPDKLSFVARHFPLSQYQHSMLSAEAAEAAGDQGKFWEMYDLIYTHQADWESASNDEARAIFVSFAEQLELNLEQFNTALDNHTFRDKVLRDAADGNAAGVTGTPAFFVDGVRFTGSLQNLVTLIEARINTTEEVVENEN